MRGWFCFVGTIPTLHKFKGQNVRLRPLVHRFKSTKVIAFSCGK